MNNQSVSLSQIIPLNPVLTPKGGTLKAIHPLRHKLKVSVAEGTYLLDHSKIIRVEADSNYSTIHWQGGSPIVVSKSLKYLEAQLPNELFFRIHSSHIISLAHIHFVSKSELILNDNSTIPISRRKKSQLNDLLMQI